MGLVAPRHVGSSQTRDWTVSPALEGGFLTTAPPGKSLSWFLFLKGSISSSCECINPNIAQESSQWEQCMWNVKHPDRSLGCHNRATGLPGTSRTRRWFKKILYGPRASKKSQLTNTLRAFSSSPGVLLLCWLVVMDHRQSRHEKFAAKIAARNICWALFMTQAHFAGNNFLSPHYNLIILMARMKISEAQTGVALPTEWRGKVWTQAIWPQGPYA